MAGTAFRDDAQRDFVHGNIKARRRMIARPVPPEVERKLVDRYHATDHKRRLPIAP
ncbi:hypothetical protein AB0H57_24665 [Micromonospora sp. NPDC050686]|uniref:hypothetical protein n=1 Tax=Micromonospora sp. NPDC050686 TaxID=3154631 RepID=UPI0033DD4280